MSTLSPIQSLLINRCAFPKTVFTPYGPKTVPCGKCLYCRKSHGRTLKSLIYNEMQDATCVQFFTLTYHEFYLPRIILNNTGEEDFPFSVPENACIYRFYPDYEKELFLSKDGQSTIYQPDLYRQDNKLLNNKEYKISSKLANEYNEQSSNDIQENHLGILFTPDLQNFFKRLRKTLQTTNNKDIRYYALSEYGGTHFRPHFHIIIFTKSFNANQIKTAVFKSWHFGNIDYAGEPHNATAAASYVSQYVTTTCHTPLLLEEISKTRTFHSKFFGLGIIKNNLEFFLTHSDYLITPPPFIYTINYFASNSSMQFHSEKLAHFPTSHYIRHQQKKLISKYSLTDTSVTSEISATPCNIKVNNYIINYIFPRPFGFARNNDYLTQILLESYDIFLSHTDKKTYENYIIWLLQRLDNHSATIYEYALGFTKSYYFKDTETPLSLKRSCSSSLLDMYLIFLEIQKQCPQYKLFTQFSDRHDAIVLINLIYNKLPPEYELTPSEWATELMVVNSIHNRMLSTYYTSKHFCLNIKQSLLNTRYYNGYTFNWHLYNIKRKRYEQLQKKHQLFNYFSTLEQNTVYPYECFTEDLNNDPLNAQYILPLQNEYLYNQTKHKEINNKLSPIFFDNSEFITY